MWKEKEGVYVRVSGWEKERSRRPSLRRRPLTDCQVQRKLQSIPYPLVFLPSLTRSLFHAFLGRRMQRMSFRSRVGFSTCARCETHSPWLPPASASVFLALSIRPCSFTTCRHCNKVRNCPLRSLSQVAVSASFLTATVPPLPRL